MEQFTVAWHDSGKEPSVPPNPDYPHGIDVDFTNAAGVDPGGSFCKVALPYPARRIGVYEVICSMCGSRVRLTTAGRPDDPRSVTVPCSAIGPRN